MIAAAIEGASVRLVPIARDVAAALLAGQPVAGIAFAAGYPSSFSLGVMDLVAGPRAAAAGAGFAAWFLVRTDDGTVVGEIGHGFDVQTATATLGYSIVESSRGCGYASDGLAALLEHLRGDARVRRIVAKTLVDHVASRRVMEKVGMQLRDQRLEEVDGELAELVVYEA